MKRIEKKYIINAIDKDTLLAYLNNNAQKDSYCIDGTYRINSIYILAWKTSGLRGRIRLRKYFTVDGESFFIENKYKDERYQYKKRERITQSDYLKIVTSKIPFETIKTISEKMLFFNKYNEVEIKNLFYNTSYERIAYSLQQEHEIVRITLDSNLQAFIKDEACCLLKNNYSILEIKGKYVNDKSIELFKLEQPNTFFNSKYKLSKQKFLSRGVSMGKDIMENELKLRVPESVTYKQIYDYFSEKYNISPYDYSTVSDTYFDTNNMVLYKSRCSFRLRRKRNMSVNFKTKGFKFDNIWSRREYRDEVDRSLINIQDVLRINNTTMEVVKSYLKTNDLDELCDSCTIISKRTSFLLRSIYFDEIGKPDIIGVCTFDIFYNSKYPSQQYREIEIEICNDLITPAIFNEIISIGNDLCIKFSLYESNMSKYETIVGDS